MIPPRVQERITALELDGVTFHQDFGFVAYAVEMLARQVELNTRLPRRQMIRLASILSGRIFVHGDMGVFVDESSSTRIAEHLWTRCTGSVHTGSFKTYTLKNSDLHFNEHVLLYALREVYS